MSRYSLVSTARRALRGLGVPEPGQRLLVALSGGADSVALLDCLKSLSVEQGFELVAAHLDHGLRAESAEDAAFCARLCASLGVPLVQGRADVRARAARERGGLEQAGRRERYAFLERARVEQGADFVSVAHTRDDQAETVLLRLLRGSAARGLAAMLPRRGRLLRPLLGAARTDVLAHLRNRGLAWREDPSNLDPAFRRNRVRHELLPLLESRFESGVRARLARTAELLAEDDAVLEARAARLYERLARAQAGVVSLPLAPLTRVPAPIARRVLRRALRASGGLGGVSAVHLARLRALVGSRAPSGKRLDLPGRRVAAFHSGRVFFGRRDGRTPPPPGRGHRRIAQPPGAAPGREARP